MKSSKWKNKNFGEAFGHSLAGISQAFCREKNLKIQLVLAVLAVSMGVVLKLTHFEWLILCLTIGMVLVAEMMNTAIEIVLDLYSEDYDEKIKMAKDIASGAVLLVSILSVIVGGILFLPKIGIMKW